MRSAPAVSYPAGRSRLLGGVLLLIWLAGVLAQALWCAQAAGPGWRQALGAAALLAAGAAAARCWRQLPAGTLRWNGQAWHWLAPGAVEEEAGRPTPVLDMQTRLALRWCAESGAVRWLWLDRARSPADGCDDWLALRRAVYAHTGTEGAPAGTPARP